MRRTICVGDVHGCLDELDELLRTVEYERPRDRLVLLGDLMDKGPDPVGVVRRAQEVGAECVLGNHDEKHLRWRRHEDRRTSNPQYKNPMKELSPERLAQNAALSAGDIEWLRRLPITLRLDEPCPETGVSAPSIAVHGGFEPGVSLDDQRPDKMLRCRFVDISGLMVPITNDVDQPDSTRRWATAFREPMHVFYGHHCMKLGEPHFDRYEDESGNYWLRCALDAGVAYGGRLVAMITTAKGRAMAMPDYQIVGIPAAQVYARPWMGDDV